MIGGTFHCFRRGQGKTLLLPMATLCRENAPNYGLSLEDTMAGAARPTSLHGYKVGQAVPAMVRALERVLQTQHEGPSILPNRVLCMLFRTWITVAFVEEVIHTPRHLSSRNNGGAK
jgi:hypothetical protein